MLGSYKGGSSDARNVDSVEHLIKLCESTRLIVDAALIDYPIGWYKIIEDFVNAIKHIPVDFMVVEGSHRQLYFIFDTKYKKHELEVFRATASATEKSRDACTVCGVYTSGFGISAYRHLCRDCFKGAGKSGKTGTWLDGFIEKQRN